jgi:lipoate-protein ligase B
MEVEDLGRTRYADALARQLQCVELRRQLRIDDTLLLTEHEPVYTIGARKGAAQHLLWGAEALATAGIEVVTTNRGGDITYHGPGQLVGYPIFSLAASRDLHAYLRDLEEVLIRSVAHFGLTAARRAGMTGIWIGNRKIAAIGVAVKSWITYHGFALNVTTDLSHFSGIIPCGITDGSVTSLAAELPEPPTMDAVKSVLILEFKNLLANR